MSDQDPECDNTTSHLRSFPRGVGQLLRWSSGEPTFYHGPLAHVFRDRTILQQSSRSIFSQRTSGALRFPSLCQRQPALEGHETDTTFGETCSSQVTAIDTLPHRLLQAVPNRTSLANQSDKQMTDCRPTISSLARTLCQLYNTRRTVWCKSVTMRPAKAVGRPTRRQLWHCTFFPGA